MSKPILCLDFDGVINSYSSGWVHATFIPDPPVPGALKFIHDAIDHFTVVIFSSRSHQEGGTIAMQIYLEYWARRDLPNDEASGWAANKVINAIAWNKQAWPKEKPSAFLSIDDRALQFCGNWAMYDPQQLLKFKPWNKREDMIAVSERLRTDPDAAP